MAPTMSTTWPASIVTASPVSGDIGLSIPPTDAWLHIPTVLRLSDREVRVVQEILAEQEQESIARALGVSQDIVYRTTQRIYIKLRIGSRIELRSRVRSEYQVYLANQAQPAKIFRAG